MSNSQGTKSAAGTAGGLLSGLRVIEAATFIFGPGAATVLGDFGADVVKIEAPGMGDPYRHIYRLPGFPSCDKNYFYLIEGRHKRSVAIDLKQPEGGEIVQRLVRGADVFISNFPLPVLGRLGLTYEQLAPLNPRLVYAHVTGYGTTGPECEKPGYDMTAYWARSGLMHGIGHATADPPLPLPGMGDHPSAMALFGGIMLALYRREQTGTGTKVSSSLLANGAWANSCRLQAALCGATPNPPWQRDAAENALINHYRSKDGRHVLLSGVSNDRDWPRLCIAIEREDLVSDPRFANAKVRGAHAREMVAILDEIFAQRTFDEWAVALERAGFPWGIIPSDAEVAADPQMRHAGAFVEFEHPQYGPTWTVNSPIELADAPKQPPTAAPGVGEQSREILRELGYSPAEVEELFSRGVVAGEATCAAKVVAGGS